MRMPQCPVALAAAVLASGPALEAGRLVVKNANPQYLWTLCFLDASGAEDATRPVLPIGPGKQVQVEVPSGQTVGFLLKDRMDHADFSFWCTATSSAAGDILNLDMRGPQAYGGKAPEVDWLPAKAELVLHGDECLAHEWLGAMKAGIKLERLLKAQEDQIRAQVAAMSQGKATSSPAPKVLWGAATAATSSTMTVPNTTPVAPATPPILKLFEAMDKN